MAADNDCRGTVYDVIGDHDRAIADHGEAICLDPDKASWWINLSDVYQHKGDFQQAMACYSQAVRLEPDKQLCWLGLAKLLKETGQCDIAMAALSAAFDLGKPVLLGLLLRGDVYECLGDTRGAISDYNEALRLEPGNSVSWRGLARLSKKTQEYDKAVVAISKVIEAKPL